MKRTESLLLLFEDYGGHWIERRCALFNLNWRMRGHVACHHGRREVERRKLLLWLPRSLLISEVLAEFVVTRLEELKLSP